MESYRVTGIPNSGPQRGCTQPSRSSRTHSNGAGTYGLSIRVQGIDGHPYVVLNNQDRGPQSYIDGYNDTEGSFIENYQEYDFRGDKEAGSSSPFMEYRTQKMTHCTDPQNGVTESQGKKPLPLLNFQKHPEILQPYDPETNSLNLESFNNFPSGPLPQVKTGSQCQSSSSKSDTHVPSNGRSTSLDQNRNLVNQEKTQPPSQNLKRNDPETPFPKPKSQPLPQAQLAQTKTRPQSQVAQPQCKPFLTNLIPVQPKPTSKSQPMPVVHPQPSPVSSPSSDQNKSCMSPSSMSSANSSLERSRREPDVLPLRRTDSSGPVLQSSSRSRHSSSPSTTKGQMDEQMEALYADTINRHENRRYIPFLPGSGRDIDTGSIPGVDELIEKFDGKEVSQQRRGRAGRRNRINPEDRKRSRSVDSALGLRNSGDVAEFSRSRGTSVEHVLRPSQLRLQKTVSGQDSWLVGADGKANRGVSSHASSAPGSPQSTISKGSGSIQGYKKPQLSSSSLPLKSKASEENASSTGKTSTTSLSASLSRPADKNLGPGADVQVKTGSVCFNNMIE